MEALTSTGLFSLPQQPTNYDEAFMKQSLLFSDSLKDLKNLRKKLYSAAEYFELSYTNDDQKQIVVNTLKDYAIKALVNTVDHLGSVSYKVGDFLDEKVDEVSGTELRVSCIEQRVRTCKDYIDREGFSQQSLVINTPKYHKRYILPVGESEDITYQTEQKYSSCSLLDEDDWHEFTSAVRAITRETPLPTISKGNSTLSASQLSQQLENFSSLDTIPQKELDNRTVSPHRFPLLLHTGSRSSQPPTTPKKSRPATPKKSRQSSPIPSRPTTPNPFTRRQHFLDPRKSASMRIPAERDIPKESEHESKSKRLLRALLSRKKSKKDEMLYTYLDEY